MRFIAQIALPESMRHGGQQMAYLFITDREEYTEGTWEPDGGENAVILQPAPFQCVVETCAVSTGPTLRSARIGKQGLLRKLRGFEPPPRELVETELTVTEVEDQQKEASASCKVGGEPEWLQNDETPADGPWDLILQVDSAMAPFDLNSGDNEIGYAFIRRDGRSARFLWQCS
jgi:hypothetical protein